MSRSEKDKTLIVASYLISKANESDTPITNKTLQKLMYYCQAWFYVTNGNKKLYSDQIEAWVHGPVVPKIFRRYTKYGYSPIDEKVDQTEFSIFSEEEKNMMDEVYDVYGRLGGGYLEALTHREDPWIKAREGLLPYETSKNVITLKSMDDFYGKRLKEARAAEA